MNQQLPRIAIVGGTGVLGTGLAYRWAIAGYTIIIGSRSSEKAAAAAEKLRTYVATSTVSSAENKEAANAADIIVLTVPYEHHGSTVEAIKDVVQGKIVIDATVPLVPPKVSRVQLPADGSVAKKTQTMLGDDVKVVSAFHNVAAAKLQQNDGHIEGDVLVYGNSNEAREMVISLVEAAGLSGWHASPIDNSVVSEALISVLIFINKKYKIDGASIQITGRSK